MEKTKKLRSEFWLLLGITLFLIASIIAMSVAVSTMREVDRGKDYIKAYNHDTAKGE